jgi:hypothetical protein
VASEFLQCRIQRLAGDVQVEFDRLVCADAGPDDAQGGKTEQRLQRPAETEGRQIWLPSGATPWAQGQLEYRRVFASANRLVVTTAHTNLFKASRQVEANG